ncbi:MAG: hypothetical protein GC134_00195 [Proteobacteria bacterium]|nr:hypothetical protein [Pseudomonadota bacterium]
MKRTLVALLLIFSVLGVGTARADDPIHMPTVISGPVQADVVSVYDGDTFTVLAYPWPGVVMHVSVRLMGLDAPEIRGKCQFEKDKAQEAKALTIANAGTHVVLKNIRHDKYAGRVLADAYTTDGQSLADLLIAAGLARPYDGGKREPWCTGQQ